MLAKILGRMWKIRETRSVPYGECDPPCKKGKEIRINPKLKGEQRLDTLLHEAIHAALWHLADEEWVAQLATDLARMLTRQGYRRDGE